MAEEKSGFTLKDAPNDPQMAYRVWPDGTVQSNEDGEPYSWMSDDFMVIHAADEDEARSLASS